MATTKKTTKKATKKTTAAKKTVTRTPRKKAAPKETQMEKVVFNIGDRIRTTAEIKMINKDVIKEGTVFTVTIKGENGCALQDKEGNILSEKVFKNFVRV